MTRQELTGERNLFFSGWIRNNLPSSESGFTATDLDFFLRNYKTKSLMLIEVKTHGGTMHFGQKESLTLLNQIIERGCPADWRYYGFHVITFAGTDFTDPVYFDGQLIAEDELITMLSI